MGIFKIIQIFSRQINKFPNLNLNTFLIVSFVKAKIAISKECLAFFNMFATLYTLSVS